MRRCCFVLAALTSLAISGGGITIKTPALDPSMYPIHVYEGDDALITCLVKDDANRTVVWKHQELQPRRWKVLTAGHDRVTVDPRIEVLHDEGGVVWVLAIKKVKSSDSGLYLCQVNSDPVVRTYHKLAVLSRDLQPPESTQTVPPVEPTVAPAVHNYTNCCISMNVTKSCLGFCDIQSILNGTTGQEPEYCELDFPSIVHCMADGRNHVPCCIEESVPDICQDVCRGEYTTITDNIKTHFSCSAYTEKTLACIVEGIEILPGRPMDVQVEPLSDSSIAVSWTPPYDNAETITDYIVNVTMLRSFDPSSLETPTEPQNSSLSIITPHSVQVNVKVSKDGNSVVIQNLSAFTMYEVTVTSRNIHGTSMPSYAVRALTLIPGQTKTYAVANTPPLPDVKVCCRNQGITHTTCLEKLCDIPQSALAEVTDLMICAPWARQTFSCLANGVDHTACCRARGLPPLCQVLCSGNITQLDFNYFKCIKYMSTYSSCLMDSYGVLPSTPTKLKVTNVNTGFAILHWEKPKTLGETVTHYDVYYRLLQDQEYNVVKATSPFILENLESDSMYEVYVAAANKHGVGEASERIVFNTLSKLIEEKIEENVNDYNVTACCIEAGLSSMCLPLCSFDASMSRLKSTGFLCSGEFSKLIRCGAGGRNHGKCCSRRGVPPVCQPLCSGVIVESVIATVSTCVPYIGNIVQCFEEGTGNLPGPVSDLQAVEVTDSEVTITWEPPTSSPNVTEYVVNYMPVDNTSMHEVRLDLDSQISTTNTTYTISGLKKGSLYNIFVVSQNDHGTSLPSSILLINVTGTALDSPIVGVTSPPHSLSVSGHSATFVTITWRPPEISHHAEQLTYNLFYKSSSDVEFFKVETTVTSHMIEGLRPNTQYIIYVTAISKNGQSLPSETLIAWTDPAYPAFVETPTVHPINLIVEGSSMTILCIAMGTPMPTISLYISGRLVRQETTRHMVTVIYNVTRDMDRISCYADNGYGTPMEARKKIVISHKPHLTASGITMAAYGDSATLQCVVDAHPEPKMMFWRDYNQRIPVIQGSKYDVSITPSKDEQDVWVMYLTIKNIVNGDEGDYFCHAENAFGNVTQPVSVRIRNVAAVNNVTQCCMEQNVSASCRDACTFYLDVDAVIDKPECINDFDKLMHCAADGSDHRSCCAHNGVERGCLDWCRGEPLFLQNNKVCLLSYTTKIMACFREGRETLPGPPQNVRVEPVDPHTVIVHWSPPIKNPHIVEMYRVAWKEYGINHTPSKNDTRSTSLKITGLKEGVMYECSVKAGSTRGTSRLTEPVKFTTNDKVIMQTASHTDDHSQVGAAIVLVLALAVVAAMIVGVVWFMRNKSLGRKSSGGVAFANPSYFREVNMDNIQIAQTGDVPMMNGSQSQTGWKHEQLHVPAQSEVPPSLYEELKLGHDGVGFKRLKP